MLFRDLEAGHNFQIGDYTERKAVMSGVKIPDTKTRYGIANAVVYDYKESYLLVTIALEQEVTDNGIWR